MTVKQEILLVAIKSMLIVIQSLILAVIILLGVLAFKIDPLKKEVRYLTLAAIFIVLNTVLQSITVQIPLFGFPSLEVGISSIPLMMAGVILGPSWGFVTGLVCDLLGLIVAPTSFPFLGFTLSSIIRALLPALIYFYYKKHPSLKLEIYLVFSLVLLMVLSSIYVFNLDLVTISKVDYVVDSPTKVGLILLILAIILLSLFVSYYAKKKFNNHYEDLILWMMMVLCSEILLSLVLSPLWLNIMYDINILASMFVRVFKALFMIPLEIILCFMIFIPIKKFIN